MKNFKNLFILFVLGTAALSFSSCSKNATDSNGNPTNPTITVTPSSDQPASSGDKVTYLVTGNSNTTSNSALTKLAISVTGTGGVTVGKEWDSVLTGTSLGAGISYSFTVPATPLPSYSITFTLTDKNGNTNSVTRNINVVSSNNGWNDQILGGQTNVSYGSFYGATTGTVYLLKDARTNSSNVDFVFFYTSADGASIGSPADADAQAAFNGGINWSNPNATTFKLVTAADFTNSNSGTALASVYTGSSASELTHTPSLSQGSTFAFKTAGATPKYGVFTVSNVSASAAGSIQFNIKVQK